MTDRPSVSDLVREARLLAAAYHYQSDDRGFMSGMIVRLANALESQRPAPSDEEVALEYQRGWPGQDDSTVVMALSLFTVSRVRAAESRLRAQQEKP